MPRTLVGSLSGDKVVVAGNIGQLYVGSWKQSEKKTALQVIQRLEDCRALFNDFELEIPDHVVSSINDLRKFLTERLQSLDEENVLSKQLRVMRAACRKFLDDSGSSPGHNMFTSANLNNSHIAVWKFCTTLGELRATCGLALALIMNVYGLECEPQLARILPADASDIA